MPMLELCRCGSRSVDVFWLAICDVGTCHHWGLRWSAREEIAFGYRLDHPRRYVDLPAVDASAMLSPEARAIGAAAQRLHLITVDHAAQRGGSATQPHPPDNKETE